jgi:two-component system, response regulator PdtaR
MELREDLHQLGYQVDAAVGDGQTAVTVARELRPDVVIMSLILSDMEGLTAAQMLITERIAPVLLLTARSDSELLARAREAGVVGCLTPPWRHSELQAAIEAALARWREFLEFERQVQALEERIATHRFMHRFMEHERLRGRDGLRHIQHQSRNRRVLMREVAEAILLEDGGPDGPGDRRAELTRTWVQAAQQAETLLNALLSDAERQQLAHEGYLEVPSTLVPGRCYRIPRSGRAPLVYEQGRPVYRLCVGPVEPLPSADLVLCHLLLMRGDERRYLATANRVPI